MGIIAGIISMLSWGIAIFLAALAARKIGNILTLLWMQIFGFIIALIYFLFSFNQYSFTGVVENLPILLVIAIFQVIAYLSFYKGLEKGDVSLVGPIGAAWGFIVALLSVIFLKEKLEELQVLGIVLIVVSIVILSFNLKILRDAKKVGLTVGVKEGIFAMFGWGISLFLLAIPSEDLGWFLPTFIFRLIFITILAIYSLITIKKVLPTKTEGFPLLLLLAVGIFDVIGFFSYSLGVNNENASIVAPISSAFALVSVILAFIFLKEKVSLQKLIGIAGIIIGLIVLSL